jgi:predicted metal-binding protein
VIENESKRVIPRKVMARVPDDILQKDLERYRKRAIELGATDAKIIPAEMVSMDERVIAKCVYPRCTFYGTNAHCPPYAMDIELARKVIKNFRHALFLWIKIPSDIIAGHEGSRNIVPWSRKTHEIVSKIESEAFFDGYKLALGFAAGSCKTMFCPNLECSALTPGQSCRQSLKARSAMEAVGMDVMDLAVKVGLDVYPIGASVSSSDVPHGFRFAIVFID